MNLERGKLVMWKNSEEKQIVYMVLDNNRDGVVVHSDNLLAVGTVVDLTKESVEPFVGTVHIESKAS